MTIGNGNRPSQNGKETEMTAITLRKPQLKKFADFIRKHECKNWFIAKDEGAYIGATSGNVDDGTFENCLFYFKGCDPSKNESYWDEARQQFGGDDFGEFFDAEIILQHADNTKVTSMKITVDPEEIIIDTRELA